MSTVNYNLKSKGVRLLSADSVWIKGKNGKYKINLKYEVLGKMDISMPCLLISVRDKKKPVYKGSTYDLNTTAKKQIVEHFYDEKGKRNKKTVAYFGIEKGGNKQ